jgi:hypothetical protein
MKFPTLSDPYARDGHRFESPQLHQPLSVFVISGRDLRKPQCARGGHQ